MNVAQAIPPMTKYRPRAATIATYSQSGTPLGRRWSCICITFVLPRGPVVVIMPRVVELVIVRQLRRQRRFRAVMRLTHQRGRRIAPSAAIAGRLSGAPPAAGHPPAGTGQRDPAAPAPARGVPGRGDRPGLLPAAGPDPWPAGGGPAGSRAGGGGPGGAAGRGERDRPVDDPGVAAAPGG